MESVRGTGSRALRASGSGRDPASGELMDISRSGPGERGGTPDDPTGQRVSLYQIPGISLGLWLVSLYQIPGISLGLWLGSLYQIYQVSV